MRKRKPQLVRGRDYIIDTDGQCVLTVGYLKTLGTCCGKECRYCPYPKAQPPPAPATDHAVRHLGIPPR